MAELLVSVRSVPEALAALDGGASLIDIKEPANGPLGRADPSVWSAVRAAIPRHVPVSVALGELRDLEAEGPPALPPGIAFAKVGLAGAGARWPTLWASHRGSLGSTRWVAVVYADADRAGSPDPDSIIAAACRADDCAGVLVDTWDKGRPSTVDLSWRNRVRAIHASGRFVALAGGLDAASIRRLAPLRPDWFAVRGAACRDGVRGGEIDPARVADLARLVASLPRE